MVKFQHLSTTDAAEQFLTTATDQSVCSGTASVILDWRYDDPGNLNDIAWAKKGTPDITFMTFSPLNIIPAFTGKVSHHTATNNGALELINPTSSDGGTYQIAVTYTSVNTINDEAIVTVYCEYTRHENTLL